MPLPKKQAPEEIIGAISLIDLTPLTAELGYWVGVQYWRQGFCTEAAQAIIDYGFNTLSFTAYLLSPSRSQTLHPAV